MNKVLGALLLSFALSACDPSATNPMLAGQDGSLGVCTCTNAPDFVTAEQYAASWCQAERDCGLLVVQSQAQFQTCVDQHAAAYPALAASCSPSVTGACTDALANYQDASGPDVCTAFYDRSARLAVCGIYGGG